MRKVGQAPTISTDRHVTEAAERAAWVSEPWRDGRFWLAELAVLVIWLGRLTVDLSLGHGIAPIAPEYTTVALFLVPVLYTALTFGATGAAITSAWVALLTIPRSLGYEHEGVVVGAWADFIQVTILVAMAILVGQRVASERTFRLRAEVARLAHLEAEIRYKGLFRANSSPVVLLDPSGTVVEANPAATRLFRHAGGARDLAGFEGRSLSELLGAESARAVQEVANAALAARDSPVSGEPLHIDTLLTSVLLRPTATSIGAMPEHPVAQVVLEDVTEETRQKQSVEAYATQVLLAEEEERRRISRELHDGPLQSLVHLCRQLDLAVAHQTQTPRPTTASGPAMPAMPAQCGESLAQELSDMRSVAEGLVDEVRAIARGLRPSILDDLGLVASIRQLVADLDHSSTMTTSFATTGTAHRLPEGTELTAFRITQEAVWNAARHANANRIAVGLAFEPEGVRVLITDDGCGFDTTRGTAQLHRGALGLAGMAERARLGGGRLQIHSAPGKGTTIEVWLPVPDVLPTAPSSLVGPIGGHRL
ncbi:MAG: PAS domain-containing sensor histidine kinase [Acidimicrobiales bacterium]